MAGQPKGLVDRHEVDAMQRKVFSKWAANHLLSAYGEQLTDVVEEFSDGIKLIKLVNSLNLKKKKNIREDVKVPEPNTFDRRRNEPMKLKCISNLNAALTAIKDDGVKIVNVSSEDINEKNQKLVLGLVWVLIVHYESGDGGAGSLAKQIVKFVNDILEKHYGQFEVPNIANFQEDSLKDGRVFKVLNHHFCDDDQRNNLSNFQKNPSDKVSHFDESLNDANEQLRVPKLLDGEGMNHASGGYDDKSVITQILQYKQLEHLKNQDEVLRDELRNKINKILDAKEKAKEINRRVSDLMDWIKKVTKELEDNPKDLHPSKIPELEQYNSNHFNKDKPEKNKEYSEILSESNKLKINNMKANLPPISTGARKLIDAWKGLGNTENVRLDYLQKMKDAYANVMSKKRIFDRKVKVAKNNMDMQDKEVAKVDSKLKAPKLGDLEEIEMMAENNGMMVDKSNENVNGISKYCDDKIAPVCPSKEYFDEQFTTAIDDLKKDQNSLKNKHNATDDELRKAKEKMDKVKNNLKANFSDLYEIKDQLENGLAHCNQTEPYKNIAELNDDKEDLDDIQVDSLRSKLDKCKSRDAENESLVNYKVPNPYIQTTPEDMDNKLNEFVEKLVTKKDQFETEGVKLRDLEKRSNEFSGKVQEVNDEIERINSKISELAEMTDREKVIAMLEDLLGEATKLSPKVSELSQQYADLPNSESEAHKLIAAIDALVTAINETIQTMATKQENNQDVKLSKDDIDKITKEFTKNDVENVKKIDYMGFYNVVVSHPPLGIRQLSEGSAEIKSFFEKYSSDNKAITLTELINGYQDSKERFVASSKDAALDMLRKLANSDNNVSESDLKGALGPQVFDRVSKNVTPTEVNGKKFYPLDQLI
ncbi:MAG: Spectrin beta chain, non-erythrocytic 1 [Paramarteilia canceri]